MNWMSIAIIVASIIIFIIFYFRLLIKVHKRGYMKGLKRAHDISNYHTKVNYIKDQLLKEINSKL